MFEKQMRGDQTESEYRIRRPDGIERWISDRAFPIRDLRVQPVWERRGHAREQAFPWSYSYLNATMGSTDDARLAGISAAHADVRIKSSVTPAKIRGL